MKQIKRNSGFISVEYVIVACICILAFTTFAMGLQAKNATRYDTIRTEVGDKTPVLPDTSNNPIFAKPNCFTLGAQGTVIGYDSSCGTDVVIPSNIEGQDVVSIAASAFQGKGIINLSIPDGVTSIGDNAFQGNYIQSVLLPNSVTTVGVNAFMNNRITSLYIPNTLTSMGERAFNDNLLPDETAYIYAYTATGRDITKIVSYGGSNKKITVPYGVNILAQRSFMGTGLQSVTIPSTVNQLGNYVFRDNALTSVLFEGVLPPALGTSIFQYDTGLTVNTIKVPAAQLAAYKAKYATNFAVASATVFY